MVIPSEASAIPVILSEASAASEVEGRTGLRWRGDYPDHQRQLRGGGWCSGRGGNSVKAIGRSQ